MGIDVLSWFDLDEESGLLTLTENAVVNYELLPKIRLKVTVTDSGTGNLQASSFFYVLVNDMNEPPQFAPLTTPPSMINILAKKDLSFSVNEYVPIGTVVVPGSTLSTFVHDYDAADTFTFTQVFGSGGDAAKSVEDLSDALTWSGADTKLSSVPYWLSEEGDLHGWFGSDVASVRASVIVPRAARNVRISLRYWSIGSWDASDNEEAKLVVNGVTLWSKKRSSSLSCDGWYDLVGLSLMAGCFHDVEIEVPVGMSTAWQCVPGFLVPLRTNEVGDVECFSKSNKHCMWGACNDALLVEASQHEVTSLSCGAEHKVKWGGTGYGISSHWCAAGRKFMGKGSSTMTVDVEGSIKDLTGSAKWGFSRFSVVSGGANIGTEQPSFKVTSAGDIVTTRPIVFNDASVRTLVVQAMDSAGLTARAVATISILDVNQPPIFAANTYVLTVSENSVSDVAAVPITAGEVMQAFDDDHQQALTYSVNAVETPIAALMFSVSTLTVNNEQVAAVAVRSNVDLDYETKKQLHAESHRD
jgi:hypothetical protein